MLHRYRYVGGDRGDVRYSGSEVPCRYRQSFGSIDRRYSNCHAHRSFGDDGYRISPSCTAGIVILNEIFNPCRSLSTRVRDQMWSEAPCLTFPCPLAGCYYKEDDSYWGDGWHGCSLQWQNWNINPQQTDGWQELDWGIDKVFPAGNRRRTSFSFSKIGQTCYHIVKQSVLTVVVCIFSRRLLLELTRIWLCCLRRGHQERKIKMLSMQLSWTCLRIRKKWVDPISPVRQASSSLAEGHSIDDQTISSLFVTVSCSRFSLAYFYL